MPTVASAMARVQIKGLIFGSSRCRIDDTIQPDDRAPVLEDFMNLGWREALAGGNPTR
jgi:hypothetical protein